VRSFPDNAQHPILSLEPCLIASVMAPDVATKPALLPVSRLHHADSASTATNWTGAFRCVVYTGTPMPVSVPETIDKLYACLQLMSAGARSRHGARWCCVGSDGSISGGPYHAAELAYRIHCGLIDSRDWVVDAKTARRFMVGRHRFLSQWLAYDADNERRILRGLLICVRRSARDGSLPSAVALPAWIGDVLTPEEKRAFHIMSLSPSSSPVEVKKRHRELVASHHPDRGGEPEKMKEINWAYEIVQKVSSF